MSTLPDPFKEHRETSGRLNCDFQGEEVPMILRHEDVRQAAKDWKSLSSDAPFRVPIPSEEDVRSVRQLPIETDPPEHGEYREIVEPFFRRPKEPEVVAKVEALIDGLLSQAFTRDSVEIVREFALPLQSRALTYLLNVPESEADIWIGWGTHVFRDGGSGAKKGAALEDYLNRKFDQAMDQPGPDFFSALAHAAFRGRPLTREEMLGFANLTFAGGRDTIIQTVANAIAYLGSNPGALSFLRQDPSRITHAAEEVFRAFTPLTHIGRVCPRETDVLGFTVAKKGRVSLCWASANLDERVFKDPAEVQLDRKPNPHVAFGFGTHLCLGAPHARLILRTLLEALVRRAGAITVLREAAHWENERTYSRPNGFDVLWVRIAERSP
jgi:cytochrome P450